MKTPYTTRELDDLIEACIEFTDSTGQTEFYQGNIAGRKAVSSDLDHVKRIMEWLAGMNHDILEGVGFDVHHVYHYRLGPHARQLVQEGGFRDYFRKKNRQSIFEEWLRWSPVAIAFIALLISAAAWLFPRERPGRIGQLESQMEKLRTEQENLKKAFGSLKETADSPAVRQQQAP